MSSRIIIDCDAGVDDCQALMLALSSHTTGTIEIVAITTVTGNVHNQKVIRNVKRCVAVQSLDNLRRGLPILDIPVYYGAEEPMIVDVDEAEKHAMFWHGNDGIGGSSSAIDEGVRMACSHHEATSADKLLDPRPTDETPAAVKMAQLVLSSPGEISIVALGPMTNVALACKLFPTFPMSVKEFTFMGGTRFARGNANLTAEFNAYGDPEALQVVLRAFAGKATMVGWDLTCRCGVPFDWTSEQWFGDTADGIAGTNPVGSFLELVSREIMRKSREGPWKDCGLLVPDPLAMAVAILPPKDLGVQKRSYFATVELGGKRTRGMVVIDSDGLFANQRDGGGEGEKSTAAGSAYANLSVVTEMNVDLFMAALMR